MLTNISEEELIFIESLCDPICLSECLFHDVDALGLYEEKQFASLRIGQFPMMSYEYMMDYDPKLSEKDNFRLREGAGNIWCFGGRRYGKSLCVEKLDIFCDGINNPANKVGFNSYDAGHIEGMLEDVIVGWEQHSFLKLFNSKRIKRNPYTIRLRNGWSLIGINSNNSGKNPGDQFFQKHLKKLYIEEAAQEITKVYEKRIDAVDEMGCVLKGEPVLMSDFSTKPIEEVVVGEEILGWDENKSQIVKQKVLANLYQGKKDVFNIQSENSSVWLTSDHKIFHNTPGDVTYRWADCIRCETTPYSVRVFPSVINEIEFNKGILCGLIDSDGYIQEIQGKTGITYQVNIYQSDEVETIKYLLDFFNITYSLYEESSPWGVKKIKRFHIKRKHNKFILELFNNDIVEFHKGYLSGFIVGDGWIHKEGNFYITQTTKKINQINRIEKSLKKLNLKYNKISRKDGYCVDYSINRFLLPFIIPKSRKSQKWLDIILKKERPYLPRERVRVKGFKGNQDVYDLTTETHNFIVGGIIVHNCVFRIAGMTNFTKYSPAGRAFYDLKNKSWIMNVPQYINPQWDVKEKKKAIKKHQGEQSTSYRIFVKGEVVEDGISVLDMERVRNCYTERRKLKTFEINKDNFAHFKQLLILEKPVNAEVCYICADVGETAPTEIIVMFKVNNVYQYHYNITCYNLTHKQQFKLFEWLSQKLEAHYVGIDTTDQLGRAIFRDLEESIGRQHLVWTGFNEKIAIGFEKDDNENLVLKDGKTVHKLEYVDAWSIQRLKHLFYEELMDCPLDDKLDTQLNSVVAMQSANRTLYECRAEADHLLAAFRVFAIAEWSNAFNLIAPVMKKKFCKIGV